MSVLQEAVASAAEPYKHLTAYQIADVSRAIADLQSAEVKTEDIKTLRATVREASQLLRVLPSMPSIYTQIFNNEAVHKVPDIRELIERRLGDETMDKDCQALVVETDQGPLVLAGIHRVHARVPERDNGLVDVRELPGNVDMIKSSPLRPLNGSENLVGYWTISQGHYSPKQSIQGFSGELVRALADVTPPGHFETTISPVRDCTKRWNREGVFVSFSDNTIRSHVAGYLANPNSRDPVMAFHLSNGAYIGWININRKSEQDWITINYVYERHMVEANKEIYARGSGKIPVSAPLQQFFPADDRGRAHAVYDDEFARPSLPALAA